MQKILEALKRKYGPTVYIIIDAHGGGHVDVGETEQHGQKEFVLSFGSLEELNHKIAQLNPVPESYTCTCQDAPETYESCCPQCEKPIYR